VRKNDPADKQFNKIMEFFEIDRMATQDDLEAVKGVLDNGDE
jgi:hypothetical protein